MSKLQASPDSDIVVNPAPSASATPFRDSALSAEDVSFILDNFYGIHYRFGMALEQAMTLGKLSRIQAAVIWIVHFSVGETGWAKRKDIELALKSWFECSGARASKLLQELSSPPFSLINQVASPYSRREKIISLTPQGTLFFLSMQQAGKSFFARYFADMSSRELKLGIRFFSLAFAVHTPEATAVSRLTALPMPVQLPDGTGGIPVGQVSPGADPTIQGQHRPETLGTALTFFFPIHYQVGVEVETLMSQGLLSRQEAAIIWLLESEADDEGWVRRCVIERALSNWFDSSNSRVSQMLRRLAGPVKGLIVQIENPASGREKIVRLSSDGKVFFESMRRVGIEYFLAYVSHLSRDELKRGARFFKQTFRANKVIPQRGF